MKLSIWAICTCDCKVNIGSYCGDHWLFFFCLSVVLLPPHKECRWPQDGWQVAGRAQSRSPANHHPPDSPWNVFFVCLFSLKRKNGFTFILYFPPGWTGGLGRGKGTLWICQEVLYPEKQILHDWTSTFALYCLCVCVCGFFLFFCFVLFFFPGKALLFFPHSALPPCPYFYFFFCVCVLGWGDKCMLNSWMRPNKTTQRIPMYFVLVENKPNRRYLYIKVQITDGWFCFFFPRDSLRRTFRTNKLEFFFFFF